jgi:hypothetical protein
MKQLLAIAVVLGTGMISARSAYAIGLCSQVCGSGIEPCSLFCYIGDPHHPTVIDCGTYTNKHCVPGLTDDDRECDVGTHALTLHADASVDLGALGEALVEDVWSAVRALPVV